MSNSSIRLGTSGFSYKDWLGNFYPQFCPQQDFLTFYASRFKTVEIDSTYYRIPTKETVQKWCRSTPDCFLFSAKFPKTVTHEGDIEERIDNAKHFISVMNECGKKLGPLLLQFPYSFKPDQKTNLFKLIHSLPEKMMFALEIRHKCWLKEEELFTLLKEKNIAFCLIDHPWMPKVDICTADFTYFRFLGDRKKIETDFSYIRYDRDEELTFWKERMLQFRENDIDIFGYFNNHYSGHAPTTCEKLAGMLAL